MGFEPATSGFPNALTTDTCSLQATNGSAICARISLRVMRKIRKRKKIPPRNWIFSFGNFLSTEINKLKTHQIQRCSSVRRETFGKSSAGITENVENILSDNTEKLVREPSLYFWKCLVILKIPFNAYLLVAKLLVEDGVGYHKKLSKIFWRQWSFPEEALLIFLNVSGIKKAY